MKSFLLVALATHAQAASLKSSLEKTEETTLAQVDSQVDSQWGGYGAGCGSGYGMGSSCGYGMGGGCGYGMGSSCGYGMGGGYGLGSSCGYGSGACGGYGNSCGYGGYGKGAGCGYGGYGMGGGCGYGSGCGYGGGYGGACGYGGGYGGGYCAPNTYKNSYNPYSQNRNCNQRSATCIGPQVQKGFRESIKCDDSDVSTRVCEVTNAPETCIIKENNSCFGGNICEDYNKVNVNARQNYNNVCNNQYCETPVMAAGGYGGCC